jgi:dUTP pyrophosphatase
MRRVYFKALRPDVVMPGYKTPGSAGFDLAAIEDVSVGPYERKVVPTGFAVALPPFYEMEVRPRSGVALNDGLLVHNGTVDSDYRGEIGVLVFNPFHDRTLVIPKHARIAQGIVKPVERVIFFPVDELDATERGAGGYGSTGDKEAVNG